MVVIPWEQVSEAYKTIVQAWPYYIWPISIFCLFKFYRILKRMERQTKFIANVCWDELKENKKNPEDYFPKQPKKKEIILDDL